MFRELAPGYRTEVDNVDKDGWHRQLEKFDDANIYQTWSYEAVRSGEEKLSHLVLKLDGEVVAAAQARIVTLPHTAIGVAYFRWAPLWRAPDNPPDPAAFVQAIRALRNEYACRRGLLVRILPVVYEDQARVFLSLLQEEGYAPSDAGSSQRTLLIDLTRSVKELREGMEQKWRNCLNHAERNDLRVEVSVEEAAFEKFIAIYKQTHDRKKFLQSSDVLDFLQVQSQLPQRLKMKTFVAYSGDTPAAGVICSGLGDTGVFLFGGTSDVGLTLKGSYLVQWKALNWLKEGGAKWYNLNGVNQVLDPGTYHFKSGLCGRNGRPVSYLGAYDACDGAVKRAMFRFVDTARLTYRKWKVSVHKTRSR